MEFNYTVVRGIVTMAHYPTLAAAVGAVVQEQRLAPTVFFDIVDSGYGADNRHLPPG